LEKDRGVLMKKKTITAIFISLVLSAVIISGCQERVLGIKIKFDQIDGLKQGDRVILDQSDIGQVKSVFYTQEGAFIVNITVKDNFANAVTENSRFFIVDDPGNKGQKAIEITRIARGGIPLKNNAVVKGSARASAFIDKNLKDFDSEMKGLEKQFDEFCKDLKSLPASEEFKELKKEIERLFQEIAEQGKTVHSKLEKEVLLRLKQALEKLKENLRKLTKKDKKKPDGIEI
jgi:paraquat-inducible protein B